MISLRAGFKNSLPFYSTLQDGKTNEYARGKNYKFSREKGELCLWFGEDITGM